MKIKNRVPLGKGWSTDKKYIATTENDETVLMRVSPLSKKGTLLKVLELLTYLKSESIAICELIEYEESAHDFTTYFQWIDGEDLNDVIRSFDEDEQYTMGIEIGISLRKIHNAPVEVPQFDWEARFLSKINNKLQAYESCEIKYENDTFFISAINKYKHLLSERPITIQHGDYHIGNMMLAKGKLVIIDFDRLDFGDPWEEFNRIVWSAQASKHFATGMVNGYFENNVPGDFWKLLLVYMCTNTLSSLPWAIPYGNKEIDTMKLQAKELVSWYSNVNNAIPSWYLGKI